ncbi:MAG: DnaJ domain-containing protein, partial [Desertifilum sp. SIO1I2]|nr:DnaJ domain-containing protein [Desertifilum sp. SIO1I2]
ALSPDGNFLASASRNEVFLWDLRPGSQLEKTKLEGRYPVTFSGDGKQLICGGQVAGSIQIFSAGIQEPLVAVTRTLAIQWWNILDVAPTASRQDVKAAYRRLAKQYHPDFNQSEQAKAKMQEINQAYQAFQTSSLKKL